MNKAVRTFVVMGIIIIFAFLLGRVYSQSWSETLLWFAGGCFMIAFGIRFLGYVIKRDRLRRAR